MTAIALVVEDDHDSAELLSTRLPRQRDVPAIVSSVVADDEPDLDDVVVVRLTNPDLPSRLASSVERGRFRLYPVTPRTHPRRVEETCNEQDSRR